MNMIPVGYMYKKVIKNPDFLKSAFVEDVYSVSGCISEDFYDDWFNEWKHNGNWLFDAPEIMVQIASEKGIDLSTMKLFFYKSSDKQWDEFKEVWEEYQPENSLITDVKLPKKMTLEGYDIVSFFCQSRAECSPLSCYSLSKSFSVNKNCLLATYEEAISVLKSGVLRDCAEGAYRIFEVYSVDT